MPDRVIRADILTSDAVNELSWAAEIFYRRLMSIADDYGRSEARPSLLRASLYPLKLDRVSEPDVVKWLGECSKAGLIRTYTINQKEYLEILKFGQRLRAMKSRYPASPDDFSQQSQAFADIRGQKTANACDRGHPSAYDCLKRNETETESETESETEKKHTPNGAGEADASPIDHQLVYKKLEKNKKSVVEYIRLQKPQFIEPYVDLWNLFAKEKSLSSVLKISDKRKRKFKVRIKESAFDFLTMLKKAGQSEFLLTGKWFGFDWILENEENYLKVIEGNYDKKNLVNSSPQGNQQAPKTFNEEIKFLVARCREGNLDERVIHPEYFDKLQVYNLIPIGILDRQPGSSLDEKKRNAVLEFIKTNANA